MGPRSLSGQKFSFLNSTLLEGFCVARGYSENIWVSAPLSHRLGLSFFSNFDNGVILTAMNRDCKFYNIVEFNESLKEISLRYDKYKLQSSSPNRSSSTERAQCMPLSEETSSSLSSSIQAMDTNGENFDSSTQTFISNNFPEFMKESPYWTTSFEASYVYQSPLQGNLLAVPSFITARHHDIPLRYYHISCTSRPHVFSSETCVRYDPFNFFGIHYRPVTAVTMKRYAVEHCCCHSPRWVTVQRAEHHGVALLPAVKPLSLAIDNEVLQLINIGLTTNQSALENAAVKNVSFSSIREEFLKCCV